jgi:hypothetical protein
VAACSLLICEESRRFPVNPGKEAIDKKRNLHDYWRKGVYFLFYKRKAVFMRKATFETFSKVLLKHFC